MKKGRILLGMLVLILGISMIFSGCLPAEEPRPEEEAPRLVKEELRELNFKKLNDVELILSNYSVFWDEEKVDRAEVALKVLEAVFVHLQVPPTQIPDWAHDIKDEAVLKAQEQNKRVDYGFLNEVLEELIKQPDYQYLASSYEKLKLWKAAVQGFINAVQDPFASYATPTEVKLGATEMSSGTYEGIGVSMNKEKGEMILTEVKKGSPAERAGLRIGDKVLKIDGMSLEGATIRHIILYIRQKEDPAITLTIEHQNGQIEDIKVVKERIEQVCLKSWPGVDLPGGRENTAETLPYIFPLSDREGNLQPDIAYLKIEDFSVQMTRDLYFVLSSLDLSKFKGLIIDVRENPGGRVDATAAAISYFLPGESVFYIERDISGRETAFLLPPQKLEWKYGLTFEPNLVPEDLPVVILVGSGSYSGAEVFAAALRDHGRTVLVGKDRTGGKGTINNWFEIEMGEYGALYIAIKLWLTPKGELIEPLHRDEEGGLLPDYLIEWSDEDYFKHGQDLNWDPEIFKAIDIIDSKK